MIEQFKALFDSISKDAKTTFLVLLIGVIYVLYNSIGEGSDEIEAMRLAQLQDLSNRLDHCEEHKKQCADRIDDMYKILNRQDSIVIELNAAIRYAGKQK